MNKCIRLYVEGQTDQQFYSKIRDNIKQKIPAKKFHVSDFKIECVKSITKFNSKLLQKFNKEVVPYHRGEEIVVFLCYDYDVFEYGVHPPVDRKKLEKDLISAGASKVKHLIALRSIEDWFMLDEQGVLKYLKLSNKTKVNGSNGLEKIKYLRCVLDCKG